MATTFAFVHPRRILTLRCDVEVGDLTVDWVEVTLNGEHVIGIDVSVHAYRTGDPLREIVRIDHMDTDEVYAVAQDAAREALRHYKVKVKSLTINGADSVRLLTMTRAEHLAAREQEILANS